MVNTGTIYTGHLNTFLSIDWNNNNQNVNKEGVNKNIPLVDK